MPHGFVTLVSGLPRSGTSMLMRMLQAGGADVWSDPTRAADPDNPHGYFELEAVKRLAKEAAWLAGAGGRVVKVVAPLAPHVPAGFPCRVLFCTRDLGEVLASQQKMISRLGTTGGALPPERLRAVMQQQLDRARACFAARPDTWVLELAHREVVSNPSAAAGRIAAFLEQPLDVGAMAAAVDASLYRNRQDGPASPGGGSQL